MSSAVNHALVGSISGEENDHVIEVVAIEEEGRSGYEIRLLSFGEGIGWYIQKTLPLDSKQAKMLATALAATEAPFKKKIIETKDISISRKVINFPVS